MAITFIRQKKIQKYLILIFVVLIIVITFVFFSDYLKEEGGEIFTSRPAASKHLPPIRIDFQVLENPIFQKLTEPFPDLPSAFPVEGVGRENPFLPYEGAYPETPETPGD